MSAFVLQREYALQLPNNYVEIEREEIEYIEGGGEISDFLIRGAENILWGIVTTVLYSQRDKISKYMIKAAVSSVAWVKAAVISAAGWVVANPGIAAGIIGGVSGFVAGWITTRYLLS